MVKAKLFNNGAQQPLNGWKGKKNTPSMNGCEAS